MSCIATMSCYNGITHEIAQGSLVECRAAVAKYLERREKRGGHGPVIRLSPLMWECCDNDHIEVHNALFESMRDERDEAQSVARELAEAWVTKNNRIEDRFLPSPETIIKALSYPTAGEAEKEEE